MWPGCTLRSFKMQHMGARGAQRKPMMSSSIGEEHHDHAILPSQSKRSVLLSLDFDFHVLSCTATEQTPSSAHHLTPRHPTGCANPNGSGCVERRADLGHRKAFMEKPQTAPEAKPLLQAAVDTLHLNNGGHLSAMFALFIFLIFKVVLQNCRVRARRCGRSSQPGPRSAQGAPG